MPRTASCAGRRGCTAATRSTSTAPSTWARPCCPAPRRPWPRSPASYARKLSDLGIAAAEAEVVTPLAVLTSYVARRYPGAVVLTVAEALVDEALTEAGFAVTADPAVADVVVVSFDRTFSYDKLHRAYRAV